MASSFTITHDTYCGWDCGPVPVFDALLASGAEMLRRRLFVGHSALRLGDGKGAIIAKADAQFATLSETQSH